MGFLDNYEPVEDRLREFWGDYPDGRVVTWLVHHAAKPGEVIIFRCDLHRATNRENDDRVAATGYAHQRLLEHPPAGRNGKPNDSAPEWTSPWEVAETSAIGRALANLGYAAKGKRPSREEVSKAYRPSEGGDGQAEAAPSSGTSSEDGSNAAASGADTLSAPSSDPSGALPDEGLEGAADAEAVGGSEVHGEGATGSPAAPGNRTERDDLWMSLLQLTGSETKARARLNTVLPRGAGYTAATVRNATVEEITRAIESMEVPA